MADLITGNTQLTATKNDVITALVQKELKFQSKLLPYVLDVSMFAVKGAKSISFPKFSSFTVVNRTSGAQGDASQLTATADQMTLDFRAYIAYIVDSTDEVQSSVEVQSLYAQRAAGAHARFVDSQLIASAVAAAGLDVGAAPITRDFILDMREFIASNDGNLAQTVLVVPPDQETEMLKITEFTQAQVYGGAVIPSGVIGSVYGIPVVIHNGMSAGSALMFDKDGLSVGFQLGPNMSEQGANEFGSQAKRVAIDQLFGVKALQLGEKGLLATQSPLIAKM